MGLCLPCLEGKAEDYNQPSPETQRRQQAEAAERRQREIEGRGVKDSEALKRKQQKREELERKADRAGGEESGLKWNVG